MPAGIDTFGFEDMEVRIYDPATKTVIKRFKSCKRAAYELGMHPDTVRDGYITKKRKYCPVLDKDIAIRLMRKDK